MKIIIYIARDDSFNYVAIQGLEKSKVNEQMVTNMVCKLLGKKMLTKFTLNNWKDNTLIIRYATNNRELAILFETIKSDVNLPENHDERSLLY